MPQHACPTCQYSYDATEAQCPSCGAAAPGALPEGFTRRREGAEKGERPTRVAPRRERGIYIILGIFLGLLGIHNFYGRHYTAGGIQLGVMVLLWWTILAPLLVALWVLLEIVTVKKDGYGQDFY